MNLQDACYVCMLLVTLYEKHSVWKFRNDFPFKKVKFYFKVLFQITYFFISEKVNSVSVYIFCVTKRQILFQMCFKMASIYSQKAFFFKLVLNLNMVQYILLFVLIFL